jgi:hypothetical protein
MEEDTTQQNYQPPLPAAPKKSKRKLIIISIVIVIVLVAVAAMVTYVLWLNSPAMKLMNSIHNTAQLQQQKFTVKVTSPKSSASGQQDTFALSGAYNKSQGVSASSTTNLFTDIGETSMQVQWIVDSKDTIYANRTSTNLTYNAKGQQKLASSGVTAASMEGLINGGANQWHKIGTTSTAVNSGLGFDPCTISAAYHFLNDTKSLTTSFGNVISSGAFTVKQPDSSDFVVTLNPSSKKVADSTYAKSDLNAFLTKCNPTDFNNKTQPISMMLDGTTMNIKIDAKKYLISNMTITAHDGTVATFSLSNVNNTSNATGSTSTGSVTVSTPKVTPPQQPNPGETAAQYLQRTQPFIYNHLMDYNQTSAQLLQSARENAQQGN